MMKIINFQTKDKEELKRIKGIKVTFISELTGKICGGLKDFLLKKLLPSQVSELTAGNLGRHCKTPVEV